MRRNRAVDTASFRESPEQSKYNHHTHAQYEIIATDGIPANEFIHKISLYGPVTIR